MSSAYSSSQGLVVEITKAKSKKAKRYVKDHGPIVRRMNSLNGGTRFQHPFKEDPMSPGFFSYWLGDSEFEFEYIGEATHLTK